MSLSETNPLKNSLLLTLGSSLAVVACYVLLYLSQFAEFGAPPVQLQFEVIFFLGALFSGLLFPFVSRFDQKQAWLVSGIALLGSAVVLFILTSINVPSPTTEVILNASLIYLLAPVIALLLANFFSQAFLDKGPLYITMLVYVVCTILANYTLDAFIPVPISTPDWLPFSIQGKINVGTLFFGIIFTQRDRIHKYGRRYAYIAISVAAVANVLVAVRLDTPIRFVIVSFAAIVLSELADTEIFQRLKKRSWFTRVASSNAVSVPVDSIIFTVFAFWGAEFASAQWMTEVILTDVVVKFAIGLLVAIQIVKPKQRLRTSVA